MDNMDNNQSKQRKETHLETRLNGLRDSNNQLELILERVQQLEVRISGDRIKDLKDEGKSCSGDPVPNKATIISDLQDSNHRTNYLLSDLSESISHLEDFI